MATVTLKEQEKWDVLTVEGELSKADILHACAKFYPLMKHAHVIWDLTRGTMNVLTRQDFEQIAAAVRPSVIRKEGRKVAYVGAGDVVFGLVCMYAAIAALRDMPGEYSAFRTLEEAEAWIRSRSG